MRVRCLNLPYAAYAKALESAALSRDESGAISQAVAGIEKVVVYGANQGTGALVRELCGKAFAGYVNSMTIDPGYVPDCAALIIATGPAHYQSCLDKLGQAWPDFAALVLLPFSAAAPASDGQDQKLCEPVPCHYKRLFVRHDGGVFPCCRLIPFSERRIGSLSDPDLPEKFANYDLGACACQGWVFRKARPDEVPGVGALNLELSLACQSDCAMCLVHSPYYTREKISYPAANFSGAARLIETIKPQTVVVQGGEVLIQEDSLKFLAGLREAHPKLKLSLITNANLPLAKAEQAAAIFDDFLVSLYGFTEASYQAVTGLGLGRALAFTDKLRELAANRVSLKLLTTPASLHEAPAYLDWALELEPPCAYVVDAQSLGYLRYDSYGLDKLDFASAKGKPLNDIYWNKLLGRVTSGLRKTLLKRRGILDKGTTSAAFEGEIFAKFGLNNDFVAREGLNNVLFVQG